MILIEGSELYKVSQNLIEQIETVIKVTERLDTNDVLGLLQTTVNWLSDRIKNN